MTKQDTINANVRLLAQQAHAAGVEPGTVLTHHSTSEAPEAKSPVKVMTAIVTYAGVDDDDKPLLGVRLNDELLGTAPVDKVEPMRFATQLTQQKKGYQLVGTRWVNPNERAGAMAIELRRAKWKGLANNPEFLTSQGKEYSDKSSVGTTACGTVGSVKPDTLCIPIEGSEAFLPQLEPRAPAKKHKEPEAEPEAKTIKEPTNKKLKKAGTSGKPKKCDGTTKPTIKAWILANAILKDLKAVHKLCGCKPLLLGQRSTAAEQTIYRNQLRKHWGM